MSMETKLTYREKKVILDTLENLQKSVLGAQDAILDLQSRVLSVETYLELDDQMTKPEPETPGGSEDEQPGAGLPWGGGRP